ncbi:MAG TPA: SGNH/GDSL hydrolase family protein [Telluria sp.]
MTDRISVKQLEGMLLDIDVPDSEIRPYLAESLEESTPLNPVVKANPAKVEMTPRAGALEGAIALASLNSISRWRRQQRYRRKIGGWTGLRIVSEGDSWFQYPFLLDDVIDNLFDRYAIYSLDAAGDLISDMVKQNELAAAVVHERPDVVLLSGGGNDVLGGSRLVNLLPPFQDGRPAKDYLGPAFDANLGKVLADYERLITRLHAINPDLRIVCHSYDHAIPANGRWLGRPLAKIGIENPKLQREIVRLIVDRFHVQLGAMTARYPNMRLVDCRRVMQIHRWHDELHPTNEGFRAVAELFARAISAQPGVEPAVYGGLETVEKMEAPESDAPAPSMAEQAQELLATYSEPILLREIGRRKKLADARDPATGDAVEVYQTSSEEVFPEQLQLGRQLADEATRVASGAIDGEKADGAMVAQAVASLSGFAGLSEAGTAMLAAVVMARLGVPPAGSAEAGAAGPH